jgi:type VII secretion-associated protein (TIGR03931 family)
MTVRVAVDFGTSSTCVAVAVDGREPQVVNVDGQPLISSAVFAAADGTLFVGQEAERQAAIDPSRYEPHPKRRIDESELLLGDRVVPLPDVIRAVLDRAVAEARRFAGGRGVELLVLTHPADWGAVRARTLRQAGAGLAHRVVLVPEPVAAAVFHAANHAMPDDHALAVLDLGGGTVDASVVRRSGGEHAVAGFDVLATKGDPHFGGADIDQILLQHLGKLVPEEQREQWAQLMSGRELGDRRRRRVVRADVRSAKETLSRHAYTDVPLPPPFADAHVTRGDLEELIQPPLQRTVELVAATVGQSRVPRGQLAGIFLVGGSSRIPQVARLVHQRLGVIPSTLDQPETVVARGALRAVTVDPEHTGGFSTGARAAQGPRRPAPSQQRPQQHQPVPAYAAGPVVRQQQSAPHPRVPAVATPPPSTERKRGGARKWWLAGGGVAAVALVVAGYFVFRPSSGNPGSGAAAARRISLYDYGFDLPAGWAQRGGDAQKRQTSAAPKGSTNADVAISVQEFLLTEPGDGANEDKFATELKSKLDKAGGFTGFDPRAKFAGRDVLYYQGTLSSTRTIDWYVLVRGTVQVSVGCQYVAGNRAAVAAPCASVVRSTQIREP